MVRTVGRFNGKIDALINNAGIASMNHMATTPISRVKEIFNTNFFGSFIFCREVAKIMARKGAGRLSIFPLWRLLIILRGKRRMPQARLRGIFYANMRTGIWQCRRACQCRRPTPIKTDLTKSVSAGKMSALINRQAIRRWENLKMWQMLQISLLMTKALL